MYRKPPGPHSDCGHLQKCYPLLQIVKKDCGFHLHFSSMDVDGNSKQSTGTFTNQNITMFMDWNKFYKRWYEQMNLIKIVKINFTLNTENVLALLGKDFVKLNLIGCRVLPIKSFMCHALINAVHEMAQGIHRQTSFLHR